MLDLILEINNRPDEDKYLGNEVMKDVFMQYRGVA